MADTLTTEQRSERMRRVRREDTTPEMTIRRALHRLGYRYVLHDRRLPGSPDLVFPARRKVVFVHGCFWHHHDGCKLATVPSSRTEYWVPKLAANRARDRAAELKLRGLGWNVLTVWQCELKNMPLILSKVISFLGPTGRVV